MDLVRAAYHSASNSLEPLARCFLSSRLQENPLFWQGRLGYYATESPAHRRPRLWLHAASVGEVTGAIPIVRALREQLPGAAITLTVTTPQGFQFARSNLSPWAQILPFPLDLPPVLDRAFQSLRPDLYVALESEFWPNLFRFLELYQTPAILLNGQLSHRSAIWYGLLKPLFQPVFRQFVGLAMHAEEDRRNVLRLGVPPERTCVLGSSKYDALVLRKDPAKVRAWRQVLDLPEGVPTIVGGSLRRQECVRLLEIFRTLKNLDSSLVGIFAPRHLTQIPNMAAWLERSRNCLPAVFPVRADRGKKNFVGNPGRPHRPAFRALRAWRPRFLWGYPGTHRRAQYRGTGGLGKTGFLRSSLAKSNR